MANVTTNFNPCIVREWKQMLLPITASTVIVEGAAVGIEISSNDVTGYLDLAGTENATGNDFVGILAEPITAADDDYATAGKLKAVLVPISRDTAECFFTVGEGTFAATDVWKTVKIGSTSIDLDVDTLGLGARITGYISSTRGKCVFSLPNTLTA